MLLLNLISSPKGTVRAPRRSSTMRRRRALSHRLQLRPPSHTGDVMIILCSNLLRGIISLLILLRIRLRLLTKGIILPQILRLLLLICALLLLLWLLCGVIPAICLLRVFLHHIALWCRVICWHLLHYGGVFLRALSFGLWRHVMCRPDLSVWGVIFPAFAMVEEEDEDADDSNDCDAADRAAYYSADGGG
jgi:hypothetical protein